MVPMSGIEVGKMYRWDCTISFESATDILKQSVLASFFQHLKNELGPFYLTEMARNLAKVLAPAL